jgi:hypothetical protein
MGTIAPEKKSSGEFVVAGEVALDGSNPTPVVTGFDVITGVSLALKGTSAPGVGTSVLTYGISGGTLNIYAWKVTNSTTTTLVASTGTETVGYVVTGY